MPLGGGAGHQLPGFHLSEHSRARLDLSAGTDACPGHERTACAHGGAGTHVHRSDVDGVAVDPPSGEIHLRFDVAAPLPKDSRPVTGGSECRWTSLPIFAPRAVA